MPALTQLANDLAVRWFLLDQRPRVAIALQNHEPCIGQTDKREAKSQRSTMARARVLGRIDKVVFTIVVMITVLLASNDFDDEDLSDVQYALFRDLNAVDGVSVAHLPARPAVGEKGTIGGIGVILKSIAPEALKTVANAFAARLSSAPEIDLELNGVKLSTRNLGADEFRAILAEALQKQKT